MHPAPAFLSLKFSGRRIKSRAPLLRIFALIGICCAGLYFAQEVHGDEPLRLTRDDLLRSFGQPEAALQKGDTTVLRFPGGVQAELRDQTVVGFRGRRDAIIISDDGTRYTLAADGTLTPETEAVEADEADEAEPEPSQISSAESAAAEEASAAPEPSKDPELESAGATAPEGPAQFLDRHGMFEEEEPPPGWVRTVTVAIELTIRFALVLLILRITLAWMGRPFFFRDAAKVSFLYTAVRESLHGVGDLGGNWQMIHLFRADEMFSFVVLTICIFQFGIANNGITALQIAVATKVTVYVLMIAIALAVTFGMLSFM